jgi:adenine-specific DNA methylase
LLKSCSSASVEAGLSTDLPLAGPSACAGELVSFRPIHYLGSKLRALSPIVAAIDRLDSTGAAVCDLFAGSGTVAYALSQRRRVIAVDIQEYSATICGALLNPAPMVAGAQFAERVRSSTSFAELTKAARPLLELEQRALAAAAAGDLQPMADILEEGALVRLDYGHSASWAPLRRAQEQAATQLGYLGTSAVCLRHFGGVFFSYAQALAFDAARLEIGRCAGDPSSLLAPLLTAMSHAVNTVGKQFAQPLRLRSKGGQLKKHLRAKVLADRAVDAIGLLADAIDSYRLLKRPLEGHEVICADYRTALGGMKGGVGVVYADPPYTRDHYSRYYHVLETIARGDEPEIAVSNLGGGAQLSRGLYRADRHQSDFCIRSKAPEAFRALFRGVREAGAPLVLSYSDFDAGEDAHPRVVDIQQVVALAEEYFARVEVEELSLFNYSKLNHGTLHKGAEGTKELLIRCRSG